MDYSTDTPAALWFSGPSGDPRHCATILRGWRGGRLVPVQGRAALSCENPGGSPWSCTRGGPPFTSSLQGEPLPAWSLGLLQFLGPRRPSAPDPRRWPDNLLLLCRGQRPHHAPRRGPTCRRCRPMRQFRTRFHPRPRKPPARDSNPRAGGPAAVTFRIEEETAGRLVAIRNPWRAAFGLQSVLSAGPRPIRRPGSRRSAGDRLRRVQRPAPWRSP